uniref:Ig-like domain-containing protein n=1 Tax=Photinus pyralis TaxID=7054 RepID=A0A1Y1LWK7_PHOPY
MTVVWFLVMVPKLTLHVLLVIYVIDCVFMNNVVTGFSNFDYENGNVILHRTRRNYEAGSGKKNSVEISSASRRSTIFSTENSTVVYAQIGGTAALPCVVRKFNSGVVSWLRRKQEPPTLLTVGLTTYSADDRFFVEHVRHLQNWGLLIKHVQPSDEGHYECQVSTHPPTSIFIQLKVTEAVAEIIGAPDLHLRAGSVLRLVCALRDSTETPSYVFWFHDRNMINYDIGIKVSPNRTSSILEIQEADQRNSGNYTCTPSNAVPASINVHVLNSTEEENPAAMLHVNCGNTLNTISSTMCAILFPYIFTCYKR